MANFEAKYADADINTLAVSLSNSSKAAAGLVLFWPLGFTTVSYSNIIHDHAFFRAMWVSVERVGLGVSVNLLITLLMAFPLSRNIQQFRPRNVYMWIVIFTMMFNGGLIPTYMTVKEVGIMDSIWALILPGAANAFNIILMMNFFRNLPKELEESANIDGAGPWYLFMKIFIPLSLPIIATITLFNIVGHWNAFFDGLIYMNRQENYPLQTYVQQLIVKFDPTVPIRQEDIDKLNAISNRTLNAAKIFVTMVPIVVVYPFLQKYFVTGITLGSVKE